MRGKRVGSAQSARGIQLGGPGSARSVREDPLVGPLPGRRPAPAGRISSAGGAPRPALGRLGKARGEGGRRSRPSALQRPPARTSPLPGAADMCTRCAFSRPSLASPPSRGGLSAGEPRGTGSLCPRRDCRSERTVLSAPQPRRVARAGSGPRKLGARGRRRCRQPTRPVLKHGPRSLTRARVRGHTYETPWRNESEGRRAPAEVGSRPPSHGGAGRTTGPSRPATSGRWSVSARDRTRKMVNYAWAGRSQRKLWWRPAAVLTCKSVVRPGYRGERLIEPSSSWFPPKFPSG